MLKMPEIGLWMMLLALCQTWQPLALERKEKRQTRQPPVYWQHQLVVDAITNKETQLKSLTRRNLKRLSNWPDWDKAFDKQMDEHQTLNPGMFGKPVPISSLPPEEQKRILRLHWTNMVKPDGRRKS